MWKEVTPSPEEQIQVLAAEIAALRQRLSALEAKIVPVEPQPHLPTPPPLPSYPPPELPQAVQQPAPPLLPPQPPPELPPARVQPGLESQVGLNLVNRIAVITLMFGAAFLFKYGVDNEWIGPGARVVLGVIAGIASLLTGHRLATKQPVFAHGMIGLGLGLLYLSFWAASNFYALISVPVAFLLMGATTATGGFLAIQHGSQAIAVLGMLGGYLTPVVLSTGEDHPWTLFSYLFVLNLGFMVPARARGWKAVAPLAMIATVALYTAWGLQHFSPANRTIATTFALAFYAQFASTGSGFIWWSVQFLTALVLAILWDRQARFLPYEIGLIVCGLAISEWKQWKLAPLWTLASFWIPYFIWANADSPEGLRGWTFAWLCASFFLFFLWTPWWTIWHPRQLRASDLSMAAGNAVLYFMASFLLLDPVRHSYMGLLAIAVASVHLGLAKALWRTDTEENKSAETPMFVMAGLALTFATLAVPIQLTGFRISIAWAIEGAMLSWIGSRFRNIWAAMGASFVLGLMLLRIAAVDAEMYSSVSNFSILINPRFLAFACGALSLWLAARFTHDAWSHEPVPPAVLYSLGHAVMLSGMALELEAWVERAFAADASSSVFTVSLSILAALYAAILIGVGVATRTSMNRAIGLVLLGLVVLKLYLMDVWELGRLYKIIAFLGLGILLLAVSSLYSRYREALGRFLQRDEPTPPPLN